MTVFDEKEKSMNVLDLPVVDLEAYLEYKNNNNNNNNNNEAIPCSVLSEAKKAAEGLHKYGLLVVRDPRASEEKNNEFLNMLERYFEQDDDVKMQDVRKEMHYQVGTTPGFTELPRNHCDKMKNFKGTDKPMSLCPPEKDPKWRFFWRIGQQPKETKFKQLNADPVIPEAIPEWTNVMDTWGSTLINAANGVAELAAVGFDLPMEAFSTKMNKGPHLLAPTATDLYKFAELNTVYAGYHYDLNFITVHGKSRFPGLFVWTREGHKVSVKVPNGCLLVQAGKQFEYLTGTKTMHFFNIYISIQRIIKKRKYKHIYSTTLN